MIRPLSPLVSIALPFCIALSLVSVQAQSPVGILHGVTANADGTPIASALVLIHRDDDNTDRSVVSCFDGAFSVPNLKPGRYEVKALKMSNRANSSRTTLEFELDSK